MISTINRLDAQPPAWLAEADLPTMARRGEELYQRHECASCHERGENPKLLTGLSERLGYKAVIEALKAPQSPMPIYPLSESQQRELAVFLLSSYREDANIEK
jgi:mono/diheme cytochrome c family protein